MNKARRVQLRKAFDLLDEAQRILDECADEERDYYDNMPESLQTSDRGQQADEDAETLRDIFDSVETAMNDLEGIESAEIAP